MNGTMGIRDMFKESLGVGHGRNFIRGTTKTDAHLFLQHVANVHWHRDKSVVRYSFKQCGIDQLWDVGRLQKQLSREGKYVFFGATRNTSDSHKAQLKSLKRARTEVDGSDEKLIELWLSASVLLNTHAVSVVIDSNLEGKIYDNGCTSGEKIYSIVNLAERMRSLTECFVLELSVL
jgi:hypothetical protein